MIGLGYRTIEIQCVNATFSSRHINTLGCSNRCWSRSGRRYFGNSNRCIDGTECFKPPLEFSAVRISLHDQAVCKMFRIVGLLPLAVWQRIQCIRNSIDASICTGIQCIDISILVSHKQTRFVCKKVQCRIGIILSPSDNRCSTTKRPRDRNFRL